MQSLRLEVVAPLTGFSRQESSGSESSEPAEKQACSTTSSPRLHSISCMDGSALPVRRGAPAYFGWYEHPAFGRIRARLIISWVEGQWCGEWDFSGQPGPCRRMHIKPHDGRSVTMTSASAEQQPMMKLKGRVAKNGTIVGEVVYDGAGDGYFKLSPVEQESRLTTGHVSLSSGCFVEASGLESTSDDLPPDCSICLQHFSAGELISRTCCSQRGHVFHTCCVQEWLKSNSTCPLCRQSLVASTTAESDPTQCAPLAHTQWSSYA